MKKILSTSLFKNIFYPDLDSSFSWQTKPIQLYRLEDLVPFLKLPTALIKLDYYFFLFLENGSIYQQVGIEKVRIQNPAIIFINAGAILSIIDVQPDAKGYFLVIENFTMTEILMEEKSIELMDIRSFINLEKDTADWYNAMGNVLTSELIVNKTNPDVAHRLLQALLYKTMQLSDAKVVRTRTEEIAMAFKKLVSQNFKAEKTTSYYANQLSISENYLNRCSKATFEKSAKELIIEIVILQAQIKLWDVTKSISQVCYELNLNDPSYFTRIFKKVTGKTPKAYQRHILENVRT